MKLSELFEDEFSPKYITRAEMIGPEEYPDDTHQMNFILYSKKLIEFMKTNCKEWLSQTNNGDAIVFRGLKTPTEKFEIAFTKPTRTDRKPRDSSAEDHELFNKLIKDAGLVANRENSIFVSGSFSHALGFSRSEWDDPYAVIPIGNFNYTWSDDLKDWTECAAGHSIENLLKDHLFGDDNTLQKAILSSNEIMISCNSALYVNYKFYQHYVRKMLHNDKIDPESWTQMPMDLL